MQALPISGGWVTRLAENLSSLCSAFGPAVAIHQELKQELEQYSTAVRQGEKCPWSHRRTWLPPLSPGSTLQIPGPAPGSQERKPDGPALDQILSIDRLSVFGQGYGVRWLLVAHQCPREVLEQLQMGFHLSQPTLGLGSESCSQAASPLAADQGLRMYPSPSLIKTCW